MRLFFHFPHNHKRNRLRHQLAALVALKKMRPIRSFTRWNARREKFYDVDSTQNAKNVSEHLLFLQTISSYL